MRKFRICFRLIFFRRSFGPQKIFQRCSILVGLLVLGFTGEGTELGQGQFQATSNPAELGFDLVKLNASMICRVAS